MINGFNPISFPNIYGICAYGSFHVFVLFGCVYIKYLTYNVHIISIYTLLAYHGNLVTTRSSHL